VLALAVSLVNHNYMAVEEQLDFLAVHESFAATEHGQALAENVRYAHFQPDEISNERWVELLGPDVNNLTHLQDTYRLSCRFIEHTARLQPGFLDEHEAAVIKATAISHDWSEAIPHIGDINYTLKTEEDEAEEEQAFVDNLAEFFDAGSFPAEMNKLVREALQTVIFDKNSRLGGAFNAIERIGYLRTALRANEHVVEESATDCHEALRWLVADVLANHHTSHLIAASSRWHAVHHFLDFQREAISRAFDMSEPGIFDASIADPRHITERQTSLKDARGIWNYWVGVELELVPPEQ
jgi:hypothetical protein